MLTRGNGRMPGGFPGVMPERLLGSLLGRLLGWLALLLVWAAALLGVVLAVAAVVAAAEDETAPVAEAGTVERVVIEPVEPLKEESVGRATAMVRIERIAAAAPSFGRLGRVEALTAGGEQMAPIGAEADALCADAVPAAVAMEPAGGPLEAVVAVAYESLTSVDGLGGDAPAAPSLVVAAAWVDAALAGYDGLSGLEGMEVDPLLVPHDLWRHGPLGLLAAVARQAAADGERERFEALRERFWEQYRIAVERRAVLGGRGP